MKLPNYIEIETSRYCNRQCEWCPNHVLQDRTVQEFMSWPDLEKIVRSLSRSQYRGWLAFHNYNEPLANPRIADELRFARQHLPDAKLTIFTNGDRLTSKLFLALVSAGLSEMRVTIYPKTMNQPEASHKKLWSWLQRKPFLQTKDWQELLVRQGPALVHAGCPEIILISPYVDRYYDRGGTIPPLSIKNRTIPCLLTSNSLSVDYKGNIKMCCNVVAGNEYHRDYLLGNVRDHDVLDVWNSQAFDVMRERHKRADWSATPICRSCRQEIKLSRE
jgi:radical SAM protein with 4Fe4S-binding SPASM domain